MVQAYQHLLRAKPKDALLLKEHDDLRAALAAASSSQVKTPAATSTNQPSRPMDDLPLQERPSVPPSGSIPMSMPMQTPDEAAAAAAAFQQDESSSPGAMQQASGGQPLPEMFEDIRGSGATPAAVPSEAGVTPSSLNLSEPAAVQASQPEAMEAPADTRSAASATPVKAQEAATYRHDTSEPGTVQAPQPQAIKPSADLLASAQPVEVASEAHQQLPETVQTSAGTVESATPIDLPSSMISAGPANTNAAEAEADAARDEPLPGNGLRQQDFPKEPLPHEHADQDSDGKALSASVQVSGAEASVNRAMPDPTGAPAGQSESLSEMNPPDPQTPASETISANKPGTLPNGVNDAALRSPAPRNSPSMNLRNPWQISKQMRKAPSHLPLLAQAQLPKTATPQTLEPAHQCHVQT